MADPDDRTIIEVALRELAEETGVMSHEVQVLGVLRCDWSEIASITGVAVTPVVGFIGELSELRLRMNEDEIKNYFTVPLKDLSSTSDWIFRKYSAPVFTPSNNDQVIWGLTAYVLSRFMQDVLFVPLATTSP
eukprot:g6340.t1